MRRWPITRSYMAARGVPRVLGGYQQNVNGVAFAPDGKMLVSAGYDAAVRIWRLKGLDLPLVATLPVR
jgi:cytochrome c